MKKIETVLLMILTVCMSMSLESCNKDDEVDFYTLSVKVTDRGNLPEAIYENINEGISSRSYPNFTSLQKRKGDIDRL